MSFRFILANRRFLLLYAELASICQRPPCIYRNTPPALGLPGLAFRNSNTLSCSVIVHWKTSTTVKMCKLIVEPKICRCSNDTDCPNRTSTIDKEFPGHLASEVTRTLAEFCNWGIQQMAIPGNILPEKLAGIKLKEEMIVVPVPDCPQMEEVAFKEELFSSPVLCQSCWEHRCYLRLTRPWNDLTGRLNSTSAATSTGMRHARWTKRGGGPVPPVRHPISPPLSSRSAPFERESRDRRRDQGRDPGLRRE